MSEKIDRLYVLVRLRGNRAVIAPDLGTPLSCRGPTVESSNRIWPEPRPHYIHEWRCSRFPFPYTHYSVLFSAVQVMAGVVEATIAAARPSAGAMAVDNNLRIASLTMAAYEYVADCRSRTSHGDSRLPSYLVTLPAEYQLYKSANRRR
jgi:hypothetical protein